MQLLRRARRSCTLVEDPLEQNAPATCRISGDLDLTPGHRGRHGLGPAATRPSPFARSRCGHLHLGIGAVIMSSWNRWRARSGFSGTGPAAVAAERHDSASGRAPSIHTAPAAAEASGSSTNVFRGRLVCLPSRVYSRNASRRSRAPEIVGAERVADEDHHRFSATTARPAGKVRAAAGRVDQQCVGLGALEAPRLRGRATRAGMNETPKSAPFLSAATIHGRCVPTPRSPSRWFRRRPHGLPAPSRHPLSQAVHEHRLHAQIARPHIERLGGERRRLVDAVVVVDLNVAVARIRVVSCS